MMRKTIVLLIVTALMIPVVVAEPAKYESGTCSLTDFPLANRFAGEGEFKQVSTSSVDMHYECHGQLFEYSSVPNEAILISYDNFPLPGSGINYVE